MKTFEFRLTQDLKGYYEGTLEIEAKSKEEAIKIFNKMDKQKIDEEVDWEHGDEYDGNYNTIQYESIEEL